MGLVLGGPHTDLHSVIEIETRASGKRLGRPPRPPRYSPGDQVGQWTVVRSADENGLPLVASPTPNQVDHGIRGSRVVECECSCGAKATVYEAHLAYGRSTRCSHCSNAIKARNRGTGKTAALRAKRASEPVVRVEDLERLERAEAARQAKLAEQQAESEAIAVMQFKQRKQAADTIRLAELARVRRLRRDGLLLGRSGFRQPYGQEEI